MGILTHLSRGIHSCACNVREMRRTRDFAPPVYIIFRLFWRKIGLAWIRLSKEMYDVKTVNKQFRCGSSACV
jgi:hypothetical protein